MATILIGVALAYLVILLRIFPDLMAPRCPWCGARLERRPVLESSQVQGHWHIGWHRYSCVQCLYFHRRPFLYREIGDAHGEPQHVH
jgi:hypothetical protein